MTNLVEYNGRKLISAESGSLKAGSGGAKSDEDESAEGDKTKDTEKEALKEGALSSTEVGELVAWVKETLDTRVSDVRPTSRLGKSPAIIVDHESASMRKLMRMVETQDDARIASSLGKQVLDVNVHHPIMLGLHARIGQDKGADAELSKEVVHQVFDNALVGAGVLDDSRSMLPRMNKLLAALVEAPAKAE